MNKKQSLQNIWAATDRPVIDTMTKKTAHVPSTVNANDSNDDNSDLESLNSSYGPFVAVPKEFRPPLPVRTKIQPPNRSLNQNKQVLSNQNPIPVTINNSEKTLPKIPHFRNPKSTPTECKLISNQKELFKKNINLSKLPEDVQNCNQDTNMDVKRKTLLPTPKTMPNNSSEKCNKVLPMKESKQENGNNEVKYEYIENKQRTVKLNFEMPTNAHLFYEDGLKFDVKKENLKQQNKGKQKTRKKANKNFHNGVEQDINKGSHRIFYEENRVKWVGSLNLGEPNNNTEEKAEKCFSKYAHKYSNQQNIVKWDSSLNLEDFSNDTKGKIGHFGKIAHKVSYQENIVKCDSSLNLEDTSSDNEGKIEWTVIQEKKTIVSAKKTDGNSNTNKQTSNNKYYFPRKPGMQNKLKKPRHRYYSNNMKSPNIDHQKNAPQHHPPDCKNTEKVVHENELDFRQSTNLKCKNTGIQNVDKYEECSLDTKNFTERCRISEKNFDIPRVSPSISNDVQDFVMKRNTRENTDYQELNSYPEKIDNVTVNHIEEQKTSLLYYGREMSDLIIGSHAALSMFISMFNEWKRSRLELINHFEHLVKNLKESSKKFNKYKDLLDFAKTGASFAAAVPLPHVSIAARVISVLTGLFSVFLSSSEKQKTEIEDANDISIAAYRDTNVSTELYMYGLQCGQQFEETAKLIEEFHSKVGDPVIFKNISPEIATFICGILEYRPRHRIFYKKLHKCFQELFHNSTSEFSKKFCEPFHLYSSTATAIDVIGFLDWRFRHDDFNGESVCHELAEIERLIESNDTSIKELAIRIQTCVGILQDELKFLEGCVKDITLFDKLEHSGVKTF